VTSRAGRAPAILAALACACVATARTARADRDPGWLYDAIVHSLPASARPTTRPSCLGDQNRRVELTHRLTVLELGLDLSNATPPGTRASLAARIGQATAAICDPMTDVNEVFGEVRAASTKASQDVIDGVFSLYFENDTNDFTLFIDAESDHDYTGGVRMQDRRRVAWRILDRLGRPSAAYFGGAVGANFYTPLRIHPLCDDFDLGASCATEDDAWQYWLDNEFPDDRPFAEWRYAAATLDLFWPSKPLVHHTSALGEEDGVAHLALELEGGRVGGGGFSGKLQRGWHAMLRAWSEGTDASPREPLGWNDPDVAIADRWSGNLLARIEQDLAVIRLPRQLVLRGSGDLSCAVGGVFVNCGGGLAVRFGWQRGASFDLPIPQSAKGATGRGDRESRNIGLLRQRTPLSAYAFARGDAMGVLYNRLLDNTIGSGEPEARRLPYVVDVTVGVALAVVGRYEILFSNLVRSEELRDPPSGRSWHHVGQIQLNLTY
jgi:hypothetical protein